MSWNGQMKERSIIFVFSNKGVANIALIISSHYVGAPGVIIGCYYVIMGTALPDLCLVREATGRGGSEENFLCLNNRPTNLDRISHKDTHKKLILILHWH